MRHIAICLIAFLIPLNASTETGSLTAENLLQFHKAYDPLFRHYCGCSDRATDPEQCTGHGFIDYAGYKKARERAKKLFDLREP